MNKIGLMKNTIGGSTIDAIIKQTFDIDRQTVTKTFDMVKPSSMSQLLTFRVRAMFRFWSFVPCHASNLFVNVLFQNTEYTNKSPFS